MKRLKRRTKQNRGHTEQIKHNKPMQRTKQGKAKVNTCINLSKKRYKIQQYAQIA